MLFLLMRPGYEHKLTGAGQLVERVKEAIARGLSKRHVPKWVFGTPEIPVCLLPSLRFFLSLFPFELFSFFSLVLF